MRALRLISAACLLLVVLTRPPGHHHDRFSGYGCSFANARHIPGAVQQQQQQQHPLYPRDSRSDDIYTAAHEDVSSGSNLLDRFELQTNVVSSRSRSLMQGVSQEDTGTAGGRGFGPNEVPTPAAPGRSRTTTANANANTSSILRVVSTALELQAAVEDGAVHIEIRDHISLLAFEASGSDPILKLLASTTKSITVRRYSKPYPKP
jgi:hypothetical protein